MPRTNELADTARERSGGQILVDCLIAHGVDTVFSVPGESFLAVLDALHDVPDKIRSIVGRHEASTANMAEAFGKLTGRPGICFVTRGPGASHASIALHTAAQDSTPLILFVGQVARDQLGREAFQEMDYREMFGGIAKWVTEIVDPRRIPELVSRAFHIAVNGRPGPVVISIPEDMQTETCEVGASAPFGRVVAAPGEEALGRLQSLVEASERPLVIVGGGGWTAAACDAIRRFSEIFAVPVAAGFRRQDLFDNSHRNYVGALGLGVDPKLADMVRRSDLLLVVGERMGDTTTSGYELIDIPRPRQTFVHVHPGPEELGMLYQGDLLINATMPDFAAALARLRPARMPDRADWIADGRRNYEQASTPRPTDLAISIGHIVQHLRETLPPDAVICNGAGSYTGFVHKFYRFRHYGTQLAPTSGAMGYGFPAALAAKAIHPDRPVVCFAGDGCFLMASQELATAVMHDLPVVVVLVDNGSYGSIRSHQERRYPGRVYATDLVNPDFAALAKAYGAHGERVMKTADFPAAFVRALHSKKPALIHLKIAIEDMLGTDPRNTGRT